MTNYKLPTVVVSEPPSPEMNNDEGEYAESDRDSLDEGSLGPQMHRDLDFSTFSINDNGVATIAQDVLPVPPDGGYGWVIVIAAFMSNLVVDGVCTSFTEFKSSYSQHFGSSDAMTALIGSLIIGVYLLVGPFVGGFVNKFGARAVVVAGACISGLAFLLAPFATNIWMFMFVYGVMGGIGFGMIYLPAIVIVGYYFESKRAVATGIAVAGSGVGTFVMPMMSEYCIATFGWATTLYVMGCIILTCVGFGLLYRPLFPPSCDEKAAEVELEPLNERAASQLSNGENGHNYSVASRNEELPRFRPRSITESMCKYKYRIGVKKYSLDAAAQDPMTRLRSALSECEPDGDEDTSPSTPVRPPLSPIVENGVSRASRSASAYQQAGAQPQLNPRPRKLTLSSMYSDMTSTNDLKASRGNLHSGQLAKVSARSFAQSLSRLSNRQDVSTLSIAMSGVDPQEFARPFNRQDIFFSGSVRNLQEFKNEGSIQGYRESVLSIPRSCIGDAASRMQNGDMNDVQSRIGGSRMSRITGGLGADEVDDMDDYYDNSNCKWIPLPIRSAFAEMIDLDLLKEPIMMLLCISNLLGMMGFYIPFVFLKDLTAAKELDPSLTRFLVPIIGITNTVGRIFFGWLADQGYVSALAINNFSLLACGVMTFAAAMLGEFWMQAVYATLFGFIISAYICLTSIVLKDLFGLEKLTNSFGLLVVSRGIASLAGSPFAGLVYDITKSYEACFYFAGVVILLSGLISCAIPYVHRWQRSQGDNEGDDGKEMDNISGKLSVLTERSEENLTEYQRTIQSLRQQHALLMELEEEKRKKGGAAVEQVAEVPEEEEKMEEDETKTALITQD